MHYVCDCYLTFFSGDFGGMLGLCLGASLLTLTEVLDFLISMCCRPFKRKEISPDDPKASPVPIPDTALPEMAIIQTLFAQNKN